MVTSRFDLLVMAAPIWIPSCLKKLPYLFFQNKIQFWLLSLFLLRQLANTGFGSCFKKPCLLVSACIFVGFFDLRKKKSDRSFFLLTPGRICLIIIPYFGPVVRQLKGMILPMSLPIHGPSRSSFLGDAQLRQPVSHGSKTGPGFWRSIWWKKNGSFGLCTRATWSGTGKPPNHGWRQVEP